MTVKIININFVPHNIFTGFVFSIEESISYAKTFPRLWQEFISLKGFKVLGNVD